jgi:hypothetical protein
MKTEVKGTFQIGKKYQLVPFDEPTLEAMKGLKKFQLVECIVKANDKRQVSMREFGLYWKCCDVVAHNSRDDNWGTKEMVDEQVRIRTGWVESTMQIEIKEEFDGKEVTMVYKHIKTKSLSPETMDEFIFNSYFSKAKVIMAEYLGVDEDELVSMAKSKMGVRL